MRRTIITDNQGRYKFQSTLPKGYGCPPDGPTQALLNELGRHGNRPAHIHFFVTADEHRKLTTQINIDGDPLVYDDFAYATREGLVPPLVEIGRHTSELQSLIRISYAVFCLKKKKNNTRMSVS